MSRSLNLALPWLFLLFIVGTILWDQSTDRGSLVLSQLEDSELVPAAASEVPATEVNEESAVAQDPICNMVIRKATAYHVSSKGRDHYFCSSYCRDEAVSNPEHWLGVTSGEATPASVGHSMRGIPAWMFQFGAVLVLLLSFGLFEFLSWRGIRSKLNGRLDLAPRSSRAQRLLRWPPLRFSAQLLVLLCFLLVIIAGLFGNQSPVMNIAPMATWTLWWAGLIFFVLYFGKLWCFVCPWDAIAGWAESLKFWGPRTRGQGFDLRWPKALRNIWPAIFLFVLLTWLELGQSATHIPRFTAYMALGMVGLALVSAFLFERKTFCRYVCLVGQVSGLYASMGATELRVRDSKACVGCTTLACYKGSESGEGCPVFEYPRVMESSTYCTMCTECIRTCPEDNLSIRLRPWGSDLARGNRPRMDEACLAVLLLSLTAFHGLTMTPHWRALVESAHTTTGIASGDLVFALLMTVLVLGPALVYAGLCFASSTLLRGAVSSKKVFLSYSYALLPIALFYHLAHNSEHFLMEGPKIVAMLSDPLGWGWNLFGTADWTLPPLVTLEGLWILQVVFILVGHLYGLWVSEKTTRRLIANRRLAFLAQLPMLVAMILSSIVSLWLLSQPMLMRISH